MKYYERLKAERKKEYDEKVAQLHKEGAEYLRLGACGMEVYTEWRLKDGKVTRVLMP